MNLNWSNTVIKYVLFVFNLIFVISGIILIAIGVSVKGYYSDYDIFLNDSYFSLPNLLIATGVLIFLISFFGCCGAYKENWFMIFIFAILLALIFILEFSAGIAGYVLRDKTTSYLTESMKNSMKDYKVGNGDDAKTYMWDTIQRKFDCCGAELAEEWTAVLNTVENGSLPVSCCTPKSGIIDNLTCSVNKTDATATGIIHPHGCVSQFGNYLKEHAVTIGGVGIAVGLIQLFGVVFACHLTKQIKHGFYST